MFGVRKPADRNSALFHISKRGEGLLQFEKTDENRRVIASSNACCAGDKHKINCKTMLVSKGI